MDAEILRVGRSLARRAPSFRRLRRLAHERGMALVADDPQLRSAAFKVVDVAPACIDGTDVAHHFAAYLSELDQPRTPIALLGEVAGSRSSAALVGRAATVAIGQMAHRFIVGSTPRSAAPELERLWRSGSATSVDLLGEATVTHQEGEAYARRCHDALQTLSTAGRSWPHRPLLEHDGLNPLPRLNLSVKVTALTPIVRAAAPARGKADAEDRLRALFRHARQAGAHLHVDMESLDSREMVLDLVLGLLAETEFRDGPSAGLVLQAYLRDADELLERVLAWEQHTPRATPLTVRLVKGAYWDHEVIDATQHGWEMPVWTTKAESDRCFERVTRRLLDAFPRLRPAIASHNLRSVAHAVVYARHIGLQDHNLEIQVLRGLGDDLQDALVAAGLRGRTYCPVGDLVSGMAYLVRRLLENTANQSFLATRADGAGLEDLLKRP